MQKALTSEERNELIESIIDDILELKEKQEITPAYSPSSTSNMM